MAIKISSTIVKLIRLANNNPNEHEANSAARRACKLLAEAIDSKPKVANRSYQDPYTSSDLYNYWEDIIRNAQNQRRETVRCNKCGGSVEEYNPQTFGQLCNKCKIENQKVYTDWGNTKDFWWYGPTENPKRTLKCTKCQAEKETIFKGIPAAFICNECQWNEYKESRR